MQNKICIIFKKEIKNYFNSPLAYIFVILFVTINSWFYFQRIFLINQTTLRPFFDIAPWILLFVVPAISMRIWSEEKKLGTYEILLTLPIKEWEIILGKFFSAFIFIVFTIFLSFGIPLTVLFLGNLDIGEVISGYIGLILISGAFLSLGIFISSLTSNQIISFLITLVSCFLLFILGQSYILAPFSGKIAQIISYLSFSSHYYNFVKGIIDTKDIFYFLSFISLFLLFNYKLILKK